MADGIRKRRRPCHRPGRNPCALTEQRLWILPQGQDAARRGGRLPWGRGLDSARFGRTEAAESEGGKCKKSLVPPRAMTITHGRTMVETGRAGGLARCSAKAVSLPGTPERTGRREGDGRPLRRGATGGERRGPVVAQAGEPAFRSCQMAPPAGTIARKGILRRSGHAGNGRQKENVASGELPAGFFSGLPWGFAPGPAFFSNVPAFAFPDSFTWLWQLNSWVRTWTILLDST